jgi:hypothetical protein
MPSTPTQKDQQEQKLGLPAGHPQAGYVSSDLSLEKGDGYGILPEEEKQWHEKRDKARAEKLDEVRDSEDKAAKEERKRAEEELKRSQEQAEKVTPSPRPGERP